MNIIVGGNEAGKSTLMEAIVLALTGRIHGKSAQEELNPYWFNATLVSDFLQNRKDGKQVALPEIHIELFLENSDELQSLCGAINSDVPTIACPGVGLHIVPNPEYAPELDKWIIEPTALLPIEYYQVDWRSFADVKLTARPRQLVTAIIDSRTVRSPFGMDYHLRQIINDHLAPSERADISLAYRNVKAEMSNTALVDVNKRIGDLHASLHSQPITLAMDQSSRTSWEGVVTPHVDAVPFSMSGQGQQAAIKISLAMARQNGTANFVMIEEPENHLSHTSLTTLLSRINSLASDQQQLFITTHSAFVLNRLGLDALLLIEHDSVAKISQLTPETVSYFQKLSGYDTLRMALSSKIVLVEGPSDEIIFERVFKDAHGKSPMEFGIDVLSMRGLPLNRCLELCSALNKKVAVLRDNDGIDPSELREPVGKYLAAGRRALFIGSIERGTTLEPQIVNHNDEKLIRMILGIKDAVDLTKWMKREKTEAALRIAMSEQKITPPQYMLEAANFIHD